MSAGPAITFASPSHPDSEMVKVFTTQLEGDFAGEDGAGFSTSPLPKSQLWNTEPVRDGSQCA